MKKQNKILIGVILIAILFMGIGYAAFTTLELTITGTANATASQDNFKVYFTGKNTVTNPTEGVVVTVNEGASTANVEISGLTKKDDTAYAILEIENGSNDVDASSIDVTLQDKDTAYFDISAIMCDQTGVTISDYAVASGAKTYVKVSAKLLQTPTEDVNTTINVTITATPAAQ